MRAQPSLPTGESIEAYVNSLLASPEGQKKVRERYQGAPKLADRTRGLHLNWLRARTTARFYTSESQISRSTVTLSVRIGGVQCGTLVLKSAGDRVFRPMNAKRFGLSPDLLKSGAQWGNRRVRGLLQSAADNVFPTAAGDVSVAERESMIEAELLKAVQKRRSQDRPACLRLYQPVLYPLKGGLPFQFPLPISARNRPPRLAVGSASGHVDVLARKGSGKCLRVFEVKCGKADDVSHALDQAVAYCATIQYLLRRTEESATFYSVMGFQGKPARRPSLEAVAVVEDTDNNRSLIEKAALRLNGGSTQPFKLFALFYKQGPKSVSCGDMQMYPRFGRT